MDEQSDIRATGAYALAALSLHLAVLNTLVEKGVLTSKEVARIAELAAASATPANVTSSSPEIAEMAQHCLQGIAESWAKRASG
jgi:hypothetical protein